VPVTEESRPWDAKGDRYFGDVMRRRQRYIQGGGAPPAWQTLVQLVRRNQFADGRGREQK
jgi:hypothetical protein